MAITISNNNIQSNYPAINAVPDAYRKNTSEKKTIPVNNKTNEHEQIRDASSNELKNYLSPAEKKVLGELFGEVQKESLMPNFHTQNNPAFLKGSKIDVVL